jgi:hypothetical protein
LARLFVRLRGSRITVKSALVSTAIMASWPIILELALLLTSRTHALTTRTSIVWLLVFAVINLLAMLGGWWAWKMLALAGPDIDDLISISPQKTSFLTWFHHRTQPTPQLFFSAGFIALGIYLLSRVVVPLEGAVQIRFVSYVMVAWSSFVGTNCVYWGETIAELAFRLYLCGKLKLQWYDPASTPGLTAISGGYVYTATALIGITIVIETVALLVPNKGESAILRQLSITFPIIAVAMGFLIGVQPFYWLYLIIKQSKAATLRKLANEIQEPDPSASRHDSQSSAIELYRLVSTAPNLPISTSTLVQVSAALVGSLVAYFLQVYFVN